MAVRSTKTERVDANATLTLVWPGGEPCGDPKIPTLEVYLRIGCLEVKVGGNGTFLQGKHGFDDTSQTTGAFRMTNVGFDASHVQGNLDTLVIQQTVLTNCVSNRTGSFEGCWTS